MNVLVTGFEPFGENTTNVTEKLVDSLPEQLENIRIFTKVLPVVFYSSSAIIMELIRKVSPEIIISLGLAAKSDSIRIETVAKNINSARIMDNEGNNPQNEKIDPHGEEFFPASLPAPRIFSRLKRSGFPVTLSQSAGSYVCNHVFYTVMNYIYATAPDIAGGFIHYPSEAVLPFHEQQKSLFLILRSIAG
ncbi:MAG: pyroglutamyl-peptidase I [Spirochaetia bacterium]